MRTQNVNFETEFDTSNSVSVHRVPNTALYTMQVQHPSRHLKLEQSKELQKSQQTLNKQN